MMEIFLIIVLCAAMFGIGVLFGAETRVGNDKTSKSKSLEEASDRELAMLFLAVGSELEKRGLVDDNPFDELEKK